MSDEIEAPAARCANCGVVLHGRFCGACGQPVKPLDPPVRYFWREFAQELFDVDSRVLRSLRRLVFSPGFLTREHVEGRRVAWVSPLKLYLITSVAVFAALAVAGDDGGLRINVTGVPSAAVDDARAIWLPRVLFVLVPFFAWLVSLVRRSSGRHYPSHLVFALHFHAAAFAVRALMTAIGLSLPGAAAPWLNSVVLIYVMVTLPLALRATYGLTRGRAIRDAVVAGLIYWFVAVVVSGGVVIAAVFRPRWMASWGL